MNFRKFYLIISSILSVFMFLLGIFTLSYIVLSEDTVATSKTPDNSLIKEILSPYKINKESINVLLMGGDKVNNNTDTIMLVNFNPATAETKILSIPRDTKVKLKGSTAKINAAYPKGGGELAVNAVSNLLGVEIKHYVFIDTSVFRKTIDILDGVDYYVPVNMDYDDPLQNLHIHIKKGQQHFNGAKAEQFMRYRQSNKKTVNEYYDGSDLKRIDAQQNFIKEVIRQKANVFYLTKLNEILNVVFKNIDTDMTINDILQLSGNLGNVKADEIKMFKLPGESVLDTAWYYIMDEVEASQIVEENFMLKSASYSPQTN